MANASAEFSYRHLYANMRILPHMVSVSIAGASGYAGGELVRILAAHPEFEISRLAAGSNAGQPLHKVHPALAALGDITLVEATPESLAADLVFLALPHGASAALVAALPSDCRVVDLGADFRLTSAEDWEMFYGGAHAGSWVYGLPELPGARPAIAEASRIANPGCYPTSVALALGPLLSAGLIDNEDIVIVSASGTSGAGRKTSESLLASEVMGSMSAYKVGGVHQHTPEMEQALSGCAGAPVQLLFTPTLAPMPRGILTTATARVTEPGDGESLREALHESYRDERFVTLLPEGQWPTTAAVAGSNSCQLQVAHDPRTGRAVIVSAIDNLVKGAAGQAVQNANIMHGLPEHTGLSALGVAP